MRNARKTNDMQLWIRLWTRLWTNCGLDCGLISPQSYSTLWCLCVSLSVGVLALQWMQTLVLWYRYKKRGVCIQHRASTPTQVDTEASKVFNVHAMSVCLSVCLYVCLSVRLSGFLSVCLYVCVCMYVM